MESALELGVATRGWFGHVNPMEETKILDRFLDISFYLIDQSEPRWEESTLSHESLSKPES